MAVTIDGITRYVLERYPGDVYAEPVTLTTVGKNIRRLRLAAGMKTQADLARKMEIPQSRVSDLENDRYAIPDTRTLMLIAMAIGCMVDDILANVDPDFDVRKLTSQREKRDMPRLKPSGRKAIRLIEGMNGAGQDIALKAILAFESGYRRNERPE